MSCVIRGMEAKVRHSSMRDFNSCSWSVNCGDANLQNGKQHHNGVSMRDSADSYSGKEKDFMKQTMLEHEAVFKDQVHELHRLYRRQRNLIDEVKGKNSNEDMNLSDHTSENASKRQLPGFLSPNSTYGEASSSQPCNSRLKNGVSWKDVDGFEVKPARVGRRMIDLQLPPDEYLDTDETSDTCEKTIYPPYRHSESGRVNASHQSNSSGSFLDVKNSNGLADLNEPLNMQESEPVALSRNILNSQFERNSADVHGQWMEKNKSQNGWMFFGAGHDRSTQRDQLHRPSHSVPVLSKNAFQSYPTTDHSMKNSSGERAYRELESSSKKPQVSYGSYVESSVASNAPRSHNDYRPNFVRPWSHWSSFSESPMSSSHQKSYPVQTNPYMYFDAHARADSSLEMRHRISNEIYQGPSSGSKQSLYNFPSTGFNTNASLPEGVKSQRFESLQEPKKKECSAGLPWLKPKPSYNSEISSGYFDLNVSTDQFMDRSDDLTNASPQKGLRYAPHSNNANMGRVEMINPQSSTKVIGCSSSEKIYKQKQPSLRSHPLFIADRHKEANHLVKRDLNINLPCDASVSVDQHGAKAFSVNKAEGKKPANFRHYIDLNSCASEDEGYGSHSIPMLERKARTWIDLEAPPTLESEEEGDSSQEKTNEKTWGLMQGQDRNSMDELIKLAAHAIVTMASSDRQCHPDDAASSSTDAAKDLLSWFAEITISCNELERKVNGSPDVRYCEGNREEYPSGEIDYLEAMTLNLQPMKEEDYMPEPLVSENLNFEVTCINRPRRGQARRGRPKRDFQRDILPGLSSLSRHEITEDIQLFGGFMKTRDQTWNTGLAARRNAKRKRVATNISQTIVCSSTTQPMDESVSVVGLEDSKLTGWGQATRRPRRQRCPPTGNPASVILT